MRTIIKILFLSIISIITSISFTSCSNDNDGDTTPPAINLTAPAEGAVLKIGSDIHFDMELSDNEMLSSYKVEIHNNFDGHNHTKSLKAEDGTTAFAFQKTLSVAGQ